LEQEASLTLYLTEKVSAVSEQLQLMKTQNQPGYIIEETCINYMTAELRPSRYNYIIGILSEEFEEEYNLMIESGILLIEAINIINYCESVFADLNFSEENEDNRFIRYAITGMISEYLQRNSENENVSHGLQQSAEATG
ncbi:MAG: hypothetical protein ACQUYJ_09830, partial [Ferruginibacter sp.]